MDSERHDHDVNEKTDSRAGDGEHHATTGGAAAAGAATGGLIGMAAGPAGAAVGAIGGAIVGAISERVMHSDDDREGKDMGLPNDGDKNPFIEDREKEHMRAGGMGHTGDVDRTGDVGRTDASGQRVQLKEEEMVAQKRMVETGHVSLEKDVVTEHRSMEVPVTREEVVIDRRPVDRRPADGPIGNEGRTHEVTVREEQVDVQTRPVVYEEVSVGKRTSQETEHVEGTVRKEVLDVDTTGNVDVRGDKGTQHTPSMTGGTAGTGMGSTGMGTGSMGMTGSTGSMGMTGTGTTGHTHKWNEGRCECGERQTT